MRVFVYECITAGGLGASVPDSLRREGRAMLDAVVDDFRRIPGVVVETLADETREPTRFRDLAAACDWALVIAPEFDDRLASYAQRVLEAGGRLLGPLPHAIRLTADKLQLAILWHQIGISHPATVLLEKNVAIAIPFPWVIKPRDGAGSKGVMVALRKSDWDRFEQVYRQELPTSDFIVQNYVRGKAVSVALLIGASQTVPLTPSRQHLAGWNMTYEGGSLPLPTPLAERATKLARHAVAGIEGLQGYVGVDLVLGDDGVDYAIEINPRLTTSYIGLRQLCEQNLAELMLRLVQGQPIETPAWRAGEVRFGADGTLTPQPLSQRARGD